MKKEIMAGAMTALCILTLAGCSESPKNSDTGIVDTSSAIQKESVQNETIRSSADNYKRIVSYCSEDYSKKSIAEFNESIKPDLNVVLESYANVMESLTPEDENYDFITLTLGASLDELYCEAMNEQIGFEGSANKKSRPIEPLNAEEDAIIKQQGQSYEFLFQVWYTLHYEITSPETLTVEQRDKLLKKFGSEMQNCVDGLSEDELMQSNIKEMLLSKASELANQLSTESMKLSCEITSVECHNAGVETQY